MESDSAPLLTFYPGLPSSDRDTPSRRFTTPLSRRAAHALLTLMVLLDIAACAWFASARPDRTRGPDEKFSLRNVEHTLRTGELRPVNPYYPGLSELPQIPILGASQMLHRMTGIEAFAVLQEEEGVTPTAYRLCRWSVVVFGAGYLLLTFVVGRRLFSTETALLGVLICMTAPLHIRATSIYKPDAILVLSVLLTFLWSLEAAEKGSLGTYLLAGLGVGLASASKQTGAFASIPLVTATILGWRQAARWLWLGAAALVSMFVFFILNPYPDQYEKLFRVLGAYTDWTGRQEDLEPGHHLSALTFMPRKLVEPEFLGPVLGVASLLGLVGLCVLLYRRRNQRPQAVRLAIFVTYPVCFVLICAAISDFHRRNVFLSLLPFCSLAAGWLLRELWLCTGARLDGWRRRLLFWPALTGFLVMVFWTAGAFLYSGVG
ncbi:MAG TPA: glycosyltransferase family 39 protein [Thermoanaerobaculia bacterium]